MNWKHTDEDILQSARKFTLLSDWRKAEPAKYAVALRRGLIGKIREFLEVQTQGMYPAYTEQELIEDAKNYKTRKEWKQAGEKLREQGRVSPFNCALRYGPEFFKRHCSHMELHHKWTDDEIIESAAKYRHKGDWRRSFDSRDRAAYQAGQLRPKVFKRATAHMKPKANPYSGSYIIYACEFSDHYVYVGLTCTPKTRHAQHMQRGPVHDHIQVCPEYAYKVLETSIGNPEGAQDRERHWQEQYETGWIALHTAKAGGLGSVVKTKW